MTRCINEDGTLSRTDLLKDDILKLLQTLKNNNQLILAIDFWKRLLTVNPPVAGVKAFLERVAVLLNDYGNYLCNDLFKFDEALVYYNIALLADDKHAPAILNNIATCLREVGRLDEAIDVYRRALAIDPGYEVAHNNLLFNLQYKIGISPADLARAHLSWEERYGSSDKKQPKDYPHSRERERRLRIGLISSDFGMHPVGIFFIRFLESIDREKFFFHCYSTYNHKDRIADRLHQAASGWDEVGGMSTDQLVAKIKDDKIDILIDLNGHTADNRLRVFAQKPAPIQMTWLGYPGHNGLSAIDYIIGDRFVLPSTQQQYINAKILHLAHSFVCFDPFPEAPPVSELPAKIPGQVLLGCFNNPVKCNEHVVKLWAAIMTRLPESRILFKYKGFAAASTQERFISQFARYGIESSRLEFEGLSSLSEMFATISRADIALDPFPFGGGMMTCLTLWMGVPIVTLPGDSFASRQSLSFLSTIGITDTVAVNAEDYCQKTVALARDLEGLSALRKRLRPAMEASPLCDGAKVALDLQNLLRNAWYHWCVQA